MKHLYFIFLITYINTYSQNSKITGVLLDVKDVPITNANVQLFLGGENISDKALKGTVTNSKGEFLFEKLNAGKYIIEISHVSYEFYFNEVSVLDNEIKNLGNIILQEQSEKLDEVIVSGKKLPITQTADKITVNVANNILSSGGTALDILKQLPIVNISTEGNVSIRRKSDIQILINGKPSGIAALQGQNFLDQLDLSTIERIEVITNPSVIKSTSGSGGVINIITKKSNRTGFDSSLNIGYGSDDWYHFSPSLKYKFEKVNLFLNYTLRNRRRLSNNTSLRTQEVLMVTETIDQNQNGIRDDKRHNFELGLDYYINDHEYFTFSGYSISRDKQDVQNRTTITRNSTGIIESRTGIIQEPEKNQGSGALLNFSSSLTDQKRLNILFDYTHTVEDEDIFREETVSSSIPDFIDGVQTFYVDTNDRYLLDFEQELIKEKRKITFGAQAIYRKINQTFNALEFDNTSSLYIDIPQLTDEFDYEDFVSSLYFQLEDSADKFSYETAIRFELLKNRYQSRSVNRTFRDQYSNFFPSIKLSYSFNDRTNTIFSLKKGINRPAPSRLNPFPDISNAFNISIGNPELEPEVFYNIELGLNSKINKVSFTTGLFFTLYKDLIQRITELRDNGITYRFPINVNNMYHFGADISLQISFAKWWKQQFGGLAFKRQFEDDFIDASEKFSYQLKTTSTISISKSFDFQIFGSYNAPDNTPQGEINAQYYIDTGLEYEFLKKKAKLTFNLTDLFNTLDERTILINENLITSSRQKINTRRAYLSFNYKF